MLTCMAAVRMCGVHETMRPATVVEIDARSTCGRARSEQASKQGSRAGATEAGGCAFDHVWLPQTPLFLCPLGC